MPPLRRFLLIALSLLAMAGATRGLEEVAVARLAATGEPAAVRAAERSVDEAARRFGALEDELTRRAAELAAHPSVESALLDSDDRGAAVTLLRSMRIPEGYAVEIYTTVPEPLAWMGPVLPLDPATRRLAFMDRIQSAVVNDGTLRQALVVWHPVRVDERVVGAVRVSRLLRVQVPVRNQYLQDFDLFQQWTLGDLARVEVILGPVAPEVGRDVVLRTVRSVDGFQLAAVTATPPPMAFLEGGLRRDFGRAFSFFASLLLGWLVLGLAVAVRLAIERALAQRTRAAAGLALAGFVIGVGAFWGLRYALLWLGVPGGFVSPVSAPPAFDPAFLGSGFGGGIARSAAELAITAVFAVVTGAAAAVAGFRIAEVRRVESRRADTPDLSPGWAVLAAGTSIISLAGLFAATGLIHRSTADATLGYFDLTGPLPEGLVMMAFTSFLLVALGALLWMGGLALAVGVRGRARAVGGASIFTVAIASVYLVAWWTYALPPGVALAAAGLAGMPAIWLSAKPPRTSTLLSVRGILLASLLVTGITYPVVSRALIAKEQARLMDAVQDFADGEDVRVAYALESVLIDARASEVVRGALALAAGGEPLPEGVADSLAADLVTGSLLAALADYRVGLTLHAPGGRPLGRYLEEAPLRGAATPAPMPPDPFAFSRLRRLYEGEAGFAGFAVERRPAGDRAGKFRFAGIGPVREGGLDDPILGWITARAEPRPTRYVSETPFPRVLVPAGLYRLADEQWVFAEFVDGVLQRSRGADFGRFRLPEGVGALPVGASTWQRERLEGQPVRTFYTRLAPDRVVAARVAATTVFDHLYFFLRLFTPAIFLALLAFLAGAVFRALRGGRGERTRLRDRVLNRFLLVGLIAIGATGLIGREVIVTQNRDAVEERLKRQLARVETQLYEDAAATSGDDQAPLTPEAILDRARLDVIGSRLGLDVNLYRRADLVGSSRSQLVRQRLIEGRLPIEAVERLFIDGERYAFTTEWIGRFRYITGFEAIPDDAGRPAVVIAVPTLPEQFAIEADQARMIAYLFGVLLLLLLVIFVIASVLANRLTRPFRRLRDGLRSVGAGEAPAEPIPVESRDEVGEVIETFNAVWDQLEDSRRRLAVQEREMAWREMARQVAHEIKNPLTPMRLSVQHLRRAYDRAGQESDGDGRFGDLLDRISGTLIEQIDTLNRIAGEFSSFGRFPERALELIDMNDVVRQAAALVGEEPRVDLRLLVEDRPVYVRADREELRRSFINLLKNAQQSIPENERGLITVRVRRQPGESEDYGWAVTTVQDTGTGIPEDLQGKIFQPNFSTKTSGMGLGLAIVRKTVEDLEGEISFETTPGRGTSFTIRLPLAYSVPDRLG
jgi:two-component system, NtrC family, nitrogen regulation sensor histidine kinase NtrY